MQNPVYRIRQTLGRLLQQDTATLQGLHLVRFGLQLGLGVVLARVWGVGQELQAWEQLGLAGAVLTMAQRTALNNYLFPKWRGAHTAEAQARLLVGLGALALLWGLCAGFLAVGLIPLWAGLPPAWAGLYGLFLAGNMAGALQEYVWVVQGRLRRAWAYGLLSVGGQMGLVGLLAYWDLPLQQVLLGLAGVGVLQGLFLFSWWPWRGSWVELRQAVAAHAHGVALLLGVALAGNAARIADGLIVQGMAGSAELVQYQYGARELPIATILAAAWSISLAGRTAQSARLSNQGLQAREFRRHAQAWRRSTARLCLWLFPLSMGLMAAAPWAFRQVYGPEFLPAAGVFQLYLLLAGSRTLFPQSIVNGLGQRRVLLAVSWLELGVNVALSILLLPLWGLQGVALATVLAHLLEKSLLAWWLHRRGLPLAVYHPLALWVVGFALLLLVYALFRTGSAFTL